MELYERHMGAPNREERQRKDIISHIVLLLAYSRTGACSGVAGGVAPGLSALARCASRQAYCVWKSCADTPAARRAGRSILCMDLPAHPNRLPCCAAEDLRRWLIAQECDLFRARFKEMVPSDQVRG